MAAWGQQLNMFLSLYFETKSSIPGNPDYVLSIQSRCVTQTIGEAVEEAVDQVWYQIQWKSSLNCFERLQQCRKKAAEQQKSQEVEQEREAIYLKCTQKAFVYDYELYCKQTDWKVIEGFGDSDEQYFTRITEKDE